MVSPAELARRVLAPVREFRLRAEAGPRLGRSVLGLLAVRTPPALAGMVLAYAELTRAWGRMVRLEGPLWVRVQARLADLAAPVDLRAALASLPALPAWPWALPVLALLAPLAVLSLWLHDAVWDHLALRLLGGTVRNSFRATLVAEAEALEAGVFGAVAGLAAALPAAGFGVWLVLLPVHAYFWGLRGFALAAWHRCPVWKGVLATALHLLLLGLLAAAFLALAASILLAELRMA